MTREARTPEPAVEADRLAAIVASSNDAILNKKLIGCLTSCNTAAERLYRYRADVVVGRALASSSADVERHGPGLGRVDRFQAARLEWAGDQ